MKAWMLTKSVNFSIKAYYSLVEHGRLELLFGGCYLESMGSVSFFCLESSSARNFECGEIK